MIPRKIFGWSRAIGTRTVTYPNHPGKHDGEALVTPQRSTAYKESRTGREVTSPPDAVVVVFSDDLLAYLTEAYAGEATELTFGTLYSFADLDHRVGVVGGFGIGAPTTAMVMEELVVDGVEAFLPVGFAGSLDPGIDMGEYVVCEKAVRDEGTSHHYAEPARFAHPSGSLLETTERVLAERDVPVHLGPSWTTDAFYRETVGEVERYASEGVLTVEMEAAAAFTVADHRGVDAAAMFVVSDYLGLSEWEPKFHLADEDLQRLGDAAKDVLASYLERTDAETSAPV